MAATADGRSPQGGIASGRQRLILSAYTSNSAGGRRGLLSLLHSLPENLETIAFVDQRFEAPALPHVQFHYVAPALLARWRAEREVRDLAIPGSVILKLGSVPPWYKSPAHTFVYFENRHLLRGESLEGMPWRNRLRVWAERLMVRLFKHHASQFLVQTESMARDLKKALGPEIPVQVRPFHLSPSPDMTAPNRDIDFIFPATGDPHKNHRKLIAAWVRLARENLRPSLCVTVDADTYAPLAGWIEDMRVKFQLNVINIGFVEPQELDSYYRRSRALIFPSTCESFGLPLAEAQQLDLPIVAAELDYVRDVVDPVETFDPASSQSIQRAVKRFLGLKEPRAAILEAGFFLAELSRQAKV